MLRHSYVLLAGLLLTQPAAAGWADALFDNLSKDFGSVPHGQVMTHTFHIKNTTKSPVTITSIRVSCGCVTATANNGSLAPGEETTLVARMDTSRFFSVRTVTIFVTFGQPSFDEVRLWVQANSRSDFAVVPDQLTFGSVKRGIGSSANVTITFYGNPGAKVTEVKSESSYIQPTITPVTSQDGVVSYQLSAKARDDTPVGKWYSDVWLTTNVPSMSQVRVPLTIEVESALSVSPEAVNLGSIKAGGEIEKRIIVRAAKPFKVTAIEGVDSELIVKENSDDAKTAHVLTLKLKPGKAGDLNRRVRIVTDLADDNKTDFRVTAQVTP
jgi:hypothetical protein